MFTYYYYLFEYLDVFSCICRIEFLEQKNSGTTCVQQSYTIENSINFFFNFTMMTKSRHITSPSVSSTHLCKLEVTIATGYHQKPRCPTSEPRLGVLPLRDARSLLRGWMIEEIVQSQAPNKVLIETPPPTRCRPSMRRRYIPDVALKNEFSMMQNCRNINLNVVNTDICWESWDLHECLWIAWETRPINVHSISWKLFTKHDSRNTKVSIFF